MQHGNPHRTHGSHPDWSKLATYTPEMGNYRKEMAGNAVETAAHNRAMTTKTV